MNPAWKNEPGAAEKEEEGKLKLEIAMDSAMRQWVDTFSHGVGGKAVTMLNLLAFNPGKRDLFMGYVKDFGPVVGEARTSGGKFVGEVVGESASGEKGEGKSEWEMAALVHYPSINHFAEMLDSEEYKELDRKYKDEGRTLKDIVILCVSEMWQSE